MGTGSHSAKTRSGSSPSSARIIPAASAGLMGGASDCRSASAARTVLGEPLVEVAGHLAQLHQGALHLAQRLGHLLGGPQLEGGVERLAPLGVGEHPPGPVGRRTTIPVRAPSRASARLRARRSVWSSAARLDARRLGVRTGLASTTGPRRPSPRRPPGVGERVDRRVLDSMGLRRGTAKPYRGADAAPNRPARGGRLGPCQ